MIQPSFRLTVINSVISLAVLGATKKQNELFRKAFNTDMNWKLKRFNILTRLVRCRIRNDSTIYISNLATRTGHPKERCQ